MNENEFSDFKDCFHENVPRFSFDQTVGSFEVRVLIGPDLVVLSISDVNGGS